MATPPAAPPPPSALFKGLGVGLIAACGFCVALQSGVNSTLGQHAGRTFAAVVSFATGLASLCVAFAVEVGSGLGAPPTLQGLRSAPWWSFFGGPLGAFFVVVVVVFAKAVGATTLTAVFVSAMLASSFALDLAGIAGFPRRAFSWPRLLGLLLMVGGVALVTLFPGEVLGRAKDAAGGQQGQEQAAAAAAAASAAAVPEATTAAAGADEAGLGAADGAGGAVSREGSRVVLLGQRAASGGSGGGAGGGGGGGRRALLLQLGRLGARGGGGGEGAGGALERRPPVARSYSSVVVPRLG